MSIARVQIIKTKTKRKRVLGKTDGCPLALPKHVFLIGIFFSLLRNIFVTSLEQKARVNRRNVGSPPVTSCRILRSDYTHAHQCTQMKCPENQIERTRLNILIVDQTRCKCIWIHIYLCFKWLEANEPESFCLCHLPPVPDSHSRSHFVLRSTQQYRSPVVHPSIHTRILFHLPFDGDISTRNSHILIHSRSLLMLCRRVYNNNIPPLHLFLFSSSLIRI